MWTIWWIAGKPPVKRKYKPSSIRAGGFFCLLIFLFFLPPSLFAEAVVLRFRLGDRIRVVERQNLSIRENGRYAGLLYRETLGYYSRGNPGETGDVRDLFEGSLLVLEELRRDNRLLSRPVQDILTAEFYLHSAGMMRRAPDTIPPLRLNFPVFPEEGVSPGDSWRIAGEFLYPRGEMGGYTIIPFMCEYRYQGETEYQGRPVSSITARYALRYTGSGEEAGLRSLTGSHEASIALFNDEKGGVFINTRVEQQIGYPDGSLKGESGFILTWYDGLAGDSQQVVRKHLEETLDEEVGEVADGRSINGEDESGTAGIITLEERPEGAALGLRDIRFLPDSAVILPEERFRLDRVAEILKGYPDRMFLVVGHTADVGTAESQYVLSVERAKKIIDELVSRGFEANRFLYRGEGGDSPVAENDTEEGRAQNRRVEIVILDG